MSYDICYPLPTRIFKLDEALGRVRQLNKFGSVNIEPQALAEFNRRTIRLRRNVS
jgi:hypothetical protein